MAAPSRARNAPGLVTRDMSRVTQARKRACNTCRALVPPFHCRHASLAGGGLCPTHTHTPPVPSTACAQHRLCPTPACSCLALPHSRLLHTHNYAAKAEAILGADQDDDIYSQIEKERAELRKQGGLTPVTFDSFVAWKERKAKEHKMAEVDKAKEMLKVLYPLSPSLPP